MIKRILAVLALFASSGTLVCCALPAAIAAILGTGALFSLVDNVPGLVFISNHKGWVFIIASILVSFNVYSLWFRPKICPIDKKDACNDGKKFSKVLTIVSLCAILLGTVTIYL